MKTALDTLLRDLPGHNGMAGSDQTGREFAAGYDDPARQTIQAGGTLVDLAGGAADVVKANGANHADAEAAASGEEITPAPPPVERAPRPPHPARRRPPAPPPVERAPSLTVTPYIAAAGADERGRARWPGRCRVELHQGDGRLRLAEW